MKTDDDVITALAADECWALLRRQEFGRMAYHDGEYVALVPINYAVDPQHRLVFRTAEGSKLLNLVKNADVAFEVDEIDEDAASSVVLHGTAHELDDGDADWVDTLPLRPWVPTEKHHVIAIEPHTLSGRKFCLDRPWRHMIPAHPVSPRAI
jgi:Mlc titration factor MtfA (ptsG expression regulator)